MQRLWQQYGKTNVGTADDVILALCKNDFGIDLSSFLYLATQTPIDLPLPTLLHRIGLKLNMRAQCNMQDKGGPNSDMAKNDIGAALTMVDKHLTVSSVAEDRAMARAGVMVGDVIIAFNKWQCDDVRFVKLVNLCKTGDVVDLHIIRDSRLLTLAFTIYTALPDTCDISIENNALFIKWLGLSS
jgi:predicted metalloprotease with PDZ domain